MLLVRLLRVNGLSLCLCRKAEKRGREGQYQRLGDFIHFTQIYILYYEYCHHHGIFMECNGLSQPSQTVKHLDRRHLHHSQSVANSSSASERV